MDDLFQMNDALDKINPVAKSDGEVTESDLNEEELVFTEDFAEDDEEVTDPNPRVRIAYSFVGIPNQVDLDSPVTIAPTPIKQVESSFFNPEEEFSQEVVDVEDIEDVEEVQEVQEIEEEVEVEETASLFVPEVVPQVPSPVTPITPVAPEIPEAPEEEEEEEVSPQPRQQPLPIKQAADLICRPQVQLNYDSFGETFVRLRKAAGLELSALAQQTLISISHLESLEHEDYNALPPPVYVAAYIRKLGNLYHLNEEEISGLTKKVRERMEYDLPEEMSKVVVKFEPSEENDEKVRHIFISFTILVVLALAALVFGIVLFFSSGKGKEKLSDPAQRNVPVISAFSESQLLEFQAPQTLDTEMLTIPPQRSGRR